MRFISNYSTGFMGRCLVQAARQKGHTVDWIECPQDAVTAKELGVQLEKRLSRCDVLVMAAAVCDARPVSVAKGKIKKEKFTQIRLVKNPDLLAGLSKKKDKSQVFIGFGLESEKLLENGAKKLKNKKLDLIALQKVTSKNKPFGKTVLQATILSPSGIVKEFKSVTKQKLAAFLVGQAEKLWQTKKRDSKIGFC